MSPTTLPAASRRRRPSANVVAITCAIVCVLSTVGSSAWAVAKITGKNIKDNTVESRDVRDHSLTARDIHRGSLDATSLAAGVLSDSVTVGSTPVTDLGGSTVLSSYTVGPGSYLLTATVNVFNTAASGYDDVLCAIDSAPTQAATYANGFQDVPFQRAAIIALNGSVTLPHTVTLSLRCSGSALATDAAHLTVTRVASSRTIGQPVFVL